MQKSFDQFLTAAREGGASVEPAFAHGFLTAVSLCPDEPDNYPWLQTLLGAALESTPPDPLQELARAACVEMDAPLRAGNFAPMVKDAADCTQWCKGFLEMVGLANDAWREFNEFYIDAGKAMLFINLLADPKQFSNLKISPLSHEQFMCEGARDLGSAVRKIAAIVSADADMPGAFEMEDLPEPWCEEDLRALSDEALMTELIALEDRVPRVMIDECIRRGAAFIPQLREHVSRDYVWSEECPRDEWWAILHAVHILGAVPGREAADILLEVMRRMQDDPHDHLWDWLDSDWPLVFQNKREHARAGLETIVFGRDNDPILRNIALECLLEAAHANGSQALESMIDRIAQMLEDKQENEELHELTGGFLLDFPRARHRPMMERLAREYEHTMSWGMPFCLNDVSRAFARANDRIDCEGRQNYLSFYDPGQILRRRQRWHDEDERAARRDEKHDDVFDYEDDFDWGTIAQTYVRPEPKVGRNDPCPCGSGKKFKKCCMSKEMLPQNIFDA